MRAAPVSKEETERREKQLEKERLRETAEKDPVVQQMLRTFRGEIVDVKRGREKASKPPFQESNLF